MLVFGLLTTFFVVFSLVWTQTVYRPNTADWAISVSQGFPFAWKVTLYYTQKQLIVTTNALSELVDVILSVASAAVLALLTKTVLR